MITTAQEHICGQCHKPFTQYYGHRPQRTCPLCKPRVGQYPQRQVLKIIPEVVVDSLPGPWSKFHTGQAGHFSSYKIDLKGSEWSGTAKGRIVLRSILPIDLGQVVQVRIMETSIHKGLGRSKYQYVALDPVDDPGSIDPTQVPHMKWSVTSYSFDEVSEDIDIEDFSLWSRSIHAKRQKEGYGMIGVLGVVSADHPIIVSSHGGDTELKLIT
jgi:hypothetical protein